MRNQIFIAVVFAAFACMGLSQNSSALGLKVAPLEYKATLQGNEPKKGFIDVSNPSGETVTVTASVQAFKQISDNGGLQFYADKQITLGIKPDIPDFELGPRQALRLYFTVSPENLPKGDVYAAIFLTTNPKQPKNGVGQLVRVGTLLSLINQSPGERKAEITGLKLPFIQFDDTVQGAYSIKNMGSQSSGFYPKVKLTSSPNGQTKNVDSSLVFGGRERTNEFSLRSGYGIHQISAQYTGSKRTRYVVTMSPLFAVVSAFILVVICIELVLLKRRRKHTAIR